MKKHNHPIIIIPIPFYIDEIVSNLDHLIIFGSYFNFIHPVDPFWSPHTNFYRSTRKNISGSIVTAGERKGLGRRWTAVTLKASVNWHHLRACFSLVHSLNPSDSLYGYLRKKPVFVACHIIFIRSRWSPPSLFPWIALFGITSQAQQCSSWDNKTHKIREAGGVLVCHKYLCHMIYCHPPL